MKKEIKLFAFVGIFIFSIFVPCLSANAYINQQSSFAIVTHSEKQILQQEYKKMENMTEDELQKQIHNTKNISEERGIYTKYELKLAWLAAAKIAEMKGYPLAAQLVKNSVYGEDYNERDGKFADAIKETSLYNKMLSHKGFCQKHRFTRSLNGDLFFAINKFKHYTYYNRNDMYIFDTFDFAADYKYDNVFVSIVNNWAFLNQNMHVLNPIKVGIEITN
ncbi:hypothetical protein KGV52_00890 [Candidatus Gracilibacteria bacterium]|nr:hypothetical protein [Candidatus Gracilibacteria bacterium]